MGSSSRMKKESDRITENEAARAAALEGGVEAGMEEAGLVKADPAVVDPETCDHVYVEQEENGVIQCRKCDDILDEAE